MRRDAAVSGLPSVSKRALRSKGKEGKQAAAREIEGLLGSSGVEGAAAGMLDGDELDDWGLDELEPRAVSKVGADPSPGVSSGIVHQVLVRAMGRCCCYCVTLVPVAHLHGQCADECRPPLSPWYRAQPRTTGSRVGGL